MVSHPFATLTARGKSGIESAEFEALFAADFTLNAPYLLKPLQDRKLAFQF